MKRNLANSTRVADTTKYEDLYTCNEYNMILVGTAIFIPIETWKGFEEDLFYHKCPKCKMGVQERFCGNCGSESVKEKYSVLRKEIPQPDIREELKSLKLRYIPFQIDQDKVDNWVIPITIDFDVSYDRSGYSLIHHDMSKTDIANQLKKDKLKYKDLIKKYNGRIIYGAIGSYYDY